MSIYGTHADGVVGFDFDVDDYTDERGAVLAYPRGFSNAYPNQSGMDWYPAGVSFAGIPAWCVTGRSDSHQSDFHGVGPWIRLEVGARVAPNYWDKTESGPRREETSALVLMDERAVESLRDDLTRWLDAPKVTPCRTGESA